MPTPPPTAAAVDALDGVGAAGGDAEPAPSVVPPPVSAAEAYDRAKMGRSQRQDVPRRSLCSFLAPIDALTALQLF